MVKTPQMRSAPGNSSSLCRIRREIGHSHPDPLRRGYECENLERAGAEA